MNASYGVSAWPNVREVNEKMDRLVGMPLLPIREEAMARYLDYFDRKCAGSRRMIEEAKQYIPGGVQHNLAFNYPFPLVIDRAEGAYLYDIDGNRYIDYLQAGGPTLLGSNYGPVNEKVWEAVRHSGPVTGLFHEYEMKLARLIQACVPSVELYRCLASGTEADMVAIRIARTFTGKERVIKIGGAYHGWSDQLVYSLHIPHTQTYEAHGIPKAVSGATGEAFPNCLDSLRRALEANEAQGGTAAVVVERDLGLDRQLLVENSRAAYALLCRNHFGDPAARMKLVGITGTSGKTTVAFLVKSILQTAGKKVGLMGTIHNEIGPLELPAKHTTPDPYQLHTMLERMAEAGCQYVVMEASSQALKYHRTRFGYLEKM